MGVLSCAALLMLAGCKDSGNTTSGASPSSAAQMDSRIMGEWLDTNTGYSLFLNADGTARVEKADQKVSFRWSTKEEGITVSNLSAPSPVWPKVEGEYDYIYDASNNTPGAAFLVINRSAPSGTNADPQTLGRWEFERK